MQNEDFVCAPVSVTAEETWAAAECIMRALAKNGPLHEALNIIRYNGFYIKKNIRSIKTHWQCQVHDYNPTIIVPEIIL